MWTRYVSVGRSVGVRSGRETEFGSDLMRMQLNEQERFLDLNDANDDPSAPSRQRGDLVKITRQ